MFDNYINEEIILDEGYEYKILIKYFLGNLVNLIQSPEIIEKIRIS